VVLRSAGFYELLEDPEAEGPGHPVAVNVDPAEGDLSPTDPRELAAAVAAPTAEDGDEEVTAAGAIEPADRERHQGLWRFVLGAAFLLLVAETLLGNRISGARRGTKEQGAGAPRKKTQTTGGGSGGTRLAAGRRGGRR